MREFERECGSDAARDALPDLVHGRLTAAERAAAEAHLAVCPACAAELAMLRRVAERARRSTPALDLDALAASVAARTIPSRRPLAPSPFAPESVATAPPATGGDARATSSAAGRARRRWAIGGRRGLPAPLRIAAALVLLALGAGGMALGRLGGGDVGAGGGVPVAARDGATPVGPVAVADTERSAGTPSAGIPGGHALGATFADLSDEELDAVLAAIDESAASLVALDPATLDPVVPGGS